MEGVILFFLKISIIYYFLGTWVGRVKVIFKFLTTGDYVLGPDKVPDTWPTEPLAYIEWYSKLKNNAEENHGMYSIYKANDAHGMPTGCILHCQLF